MSQNIKSYTYLAGRFNARRGLTPKDLEKEENWKSVGLSDELYKGLIKTYYPAFLSSVANVPAGNSRVLRYRMTDECLCVNLVLGRWNNNENRIVESPYPCRIEEVDLWFFPYCPEDIVLFSIKVDDSGVPLDDLTLMHSRWKTWEYNDFHTKELDNYLNPLAQLSRYGNIEELTYEGTKVRQYQVVQSDILSDELLYEIGTFSQIGVVGDTNICRMSKPSNDYYQEIIRENAISAFSNWKALALNDSFTVLAVDKAYVDSEFDSSEEGYLRIGYHYFELLYMRCLLEEYYCFDRNNRYRDNTTNRVKKLLKEIKYMEQHYFYDDLSYDFLPTLMIRGMEKGLGLEGDRAELTGHIKQAIGDERREKNEFTVSIVKLFAAVSAFWTLYMMFTAIFPWREGSIVALSFSGPAILFVALIIIYFLRNFLGNKRT